TEIDANLGQELAAELAARFDYIERLEEYVSRTLVKNESEKCRFGKFIKAMGPELRKEYVDILKTAETETKHMHKVCKDNIRDRASRENTENSYVCCSQGS
ncbi:hypothetical protein Ciccas_012993, partial [Cichlidogyrus casuarinus]